MSRAVQWKSESVAPLHTFDLAILKTRLASMMQVLLDMCFDISALSLPMFESSCRPVDIPMVHVGLSGQLSDTV